MLELLFKAARYIATNMQKGIYLHSFNLDAYVLYIGFKGSKLFQIRQEAVLSTLRFNPRFIRVFWDLWNPKSGFETISTGLNSSKA